MVALASGAAFSISAESSPRVLGALGTAGLAVTLMASLAFLVPLQRRIIREAPGSDDERIEVMRRRWFSGNLGRSVLSVASFALLVAGSLA